MNDSLTSPQIPSPGEVDGIAVMQDLIIRNLQITQCYHELSAVLAARTGGSANWCTFATWASKQAGQTIRQEDLRRALDRALKKLPPLNLVVERLLAVAQQLGTQRQREGIGEFVCALLNPMAAVQRASEAVARGNQKVFEEIGREFARFYGSCLSDQEFTDESIDGFCAALRLGDPPAGQSYLRQAFRRYYQSLFEPDSRRLAELLFLANIEIGFHEQTRLQPEIVASLDAAVIDPEEFVRRLLEAFLPGRSWLSLGRIFFWRLLGRLTPLREAAQELVAAARTQIHLVLTEYALLLTLPHGKKLRLGQDLQKEFPLSLRALQNPELLALLAQIDPTPDSTHDTGALDWADLSERLHYIIDFFRCYQEEPELLEPPFTAEQVISIKTGQLPVGEL